MPAAPRAHAARRHPLQARRPLAAVLLGGALVLVPSLGQAASISLGWGGFPAELEVKATQSVTDTLTPATVPWSDSHFVESAGDRSEAAYTLTDDGLDVTLQQTNAANDGALSAASSVFRFTVDEPVYVRFSGQLDVSGSARRVYQRLILRQFGIGDVYERTQESRSTADESFTLGLQEGDSYNRSVGPGAILLQPGASYLVLYNAFLQVTDDNGALGPATATGFFSMTLPEPGTGLLVGLGLVLASLRARPGTRRS